MAQPGSGEAIEQQLDAYYGDDSWLADVRDHTGLDAEAFSDLIGCFFRHRAGDGFGAALPAWAGALEGDAYEARRAEVCRSRGFSPDMSALGILHLEAIAHYAYKRPLHGEWLRSLDAAIAPGRAYRVLDYGCGASAFCDLALARPEVHCTLADVDPAVVAYLAAKYARRAPGRVATHALATTRRVAKRARVDVDFRSIEEEYDAIVLADILEHTLDPFDVLRHLLARLRPGGMLLVNYPHDIEGDWHTPEAYFLRRWCYALLRARCAHPSARIWRLRCGRLGPRAGGLLARLHPRMRRRAQQFARRYFREHGEALAAVVRARARRSVTPAELIESV